MWTEALRKKKKQQEKKHPNLDTQEAGKKKA